MICLVILIMIYLTNIGLNMKKHPYMPNKDIINLILLHLSNSNTVIE
jgi:hypothetical protein